MKKGFSSFLSYPLMLALSGRRSRRVSRGIQANSGRSGDQRGTNDDALTAFETKIVLSCVAGSTSWIHFVEMNPDYPLKAEHIPSDLMGRTYPSAGGWYPTTFFFTDDTGVHVLSRSVEAPLPDTVEEVNGPNIDLAGFTTKLTSNRLRIAPEYISAHNLKYANVEGSLLILPVCDMSQIVLEMIALLVVNGGTVVDDIAQQRLPNIHDLEVKLDLQRAMPVSAIERNALTLAASEMAIACHNGMLVLQAMGLGGWMFSGFDSAGVLCGSRRGRKNGLGFRSMKHSGNSTPNIVGLDGILEGYCPPYYEEMDCAFDSLLNNKKAFIEAHLQREGHLRKDYDNITTSGFGLSEAQTEVVKGIATYMHSKYGRFPVTVPTMFLHNMLQAHHIDLDYYLNSTNDRWLEPHVLRAENW
ncbi:hypothetical protein [Roseibium sp.]|uniref:hypothetical protein n=1 Tax=Roseibium sp. TaxID=1936156 RepID=UPI003B525329